MPYLRNVYRRIEVKKVKRFMIYFLVVLMVVIRPVKVLAQAFPDEETAYHYVRKQMELGEELISFSIGREVKNKLDFFNNSVYVSTLNWGNIEYLQVLNQSYNKNTKTTDVRLKVAYKQSKAQLDEMYALTKTWVGSNINGSMGDYEKVEKIYSYLGTSTVYETKGLKEYNSYSVYSPMALLKEGVGVCNAYSGLFKLLAEEAGLEVREVFGTNKANGLSHVWNMVKIGDTWYHIDLAQASKEVSKTVDKRFSYMTSSQDMEKYYSFNKEGQPLAGAKYFT